MCSWNVFEKVLLSGEMLNMLNMLNAFGTYRPLVNEANKFQKHSTYSTFQHFPRNKHILGERLSNIFNIFNISAERSTFLKNMLLSAVMLNVVPPSGNWGVQKGSVSSKNIQHIQHIQHFRRKKHFFERGF